MGCDFVLRNSSNCKLGTYKVNTSKPIEEELVRIIREEKIVIVEGDSITVESS